MLIDANTRGTCNEPFHQTAGGHWFIKLTFRMGDRPADKVTDRLYVADLEGAQQLSENNTCGITAILNLSEYETYPVFVAPEDYLHLVFADGQPCTADVFWKAMEFCKRVYSEGKTLLIHCAYGSSRSVNFLEAFMVLQGLASSMDDAHAQELLARPESAKWPPSPVLRAAVIQLMEKK